MGTTEPEKIGLLQNDRRRCDGVLAGSDYTRNQGKSRSVAILAEVCQTGSLSDGCFGGTDE